VCELIWVTVDPATCTPNPAMQPLAADLVRCIMELRPRFTTALRIAQAGESCVLVSGVSVQGAWRVDAFVRRWWWFPLCQLNRACPCKPQRPPNAHPMHTEDEGRPSADDDVADEFDDDFDAIKGMGRLFCEVGVDGMSACACACVCVCVCVRACVCACVYRSSSQTPTHRTAPGG